MMQSAVGVQALYAGFWRRYWALVIDLWLFAVMTGTIAVVTSGSHAGALATVLALLYFVGLDVEGGTIGKRALRLRVVRTNGSRVSIFRACLRELIGKPLSALPLMLGYLWCLDGRHRQAWHDQLADTIVVHEVPTQNGPPWRFAPPWLTGGTGLTPPPAPPTPEGPSLPVEPLRPSGETSAPPDSDAPSNSGDAG